jgi:D-tyrosyl-tRNA(Tyr) deacylase
MRLVVQRVKRASVKTKNKVLGQISQGLVLLVAINQKDNEKTVQSMAKKVLDLRIFGDQEDKMNLSVLDIEREILVVSQFTLYADCSKGNRPYFGNVARPEKAKALMKEFIQALKKSGLKVEKGEFGAKMKVDLINDGPVTIILDSDG